ncbi:MAG: acyl-CoA/acyl-ACP dehydrogenase [Gammaproteobacteria bacterium]|nr:acyl-CoA/acyl-ACP dehydrogenase [Gammaproteobacteria bacterium]MBU1440288.1 acyl-CoA/acyl-ACP dehydrogenase [Gammaproteobacteria bacterium]MBU2410934.1 acyl-CoA/acyl-ACP dehydrogenase [Gammaproteobacteria bacterium]
MSFAPLFPGMLLDSASRYAQDHAGAEPSGDPLRELGWTATVVPEEAGGVGGTLADLASIVEGLATHGLQLPVVEACAIVPLLLQAAGPELARPWLESVAEGTARVAPLTALSASLDETTVQAKRFDSGFELDGDVDGVDVTLPTESASHWLVPAQVDGELALFLVDVERIGAPSATYRTMEGRKGGDFALKKLAVPEGACIARGEAVRAALRAADDAALLLTATDTVAALSALVQQTIAYLKERKQFGVSLSTFQVLRHRSAEMYVKYLAARGLLLHCFQEQEAGAADLRRTLRVAKVALAETARWCAEAAIQMHGGMGMSEEVLATRLAQRLLASEFRYGDRLTHATRLLAPQAAEARPLVNHLTGSAP